MILMFRKSINGINQLFNDDSGIPEGSVILVSGVEGGLKSGIVINMLSNNNAEKDHHALYQT